MPRLRGFIIGIFCLALVAQGYARTPADVKQVSETRLKFKGTLGAVMRFMGANKPMRTATFLKGNALRTDQFDKKGKLTHSTIIDLERGVILTLDHKEKQVQQMTLEEWKQMMQSAAESFGQTEEEPGKEEEKTEVEWDFKVDVQRPGEHKKVAGFDAEKAILTLTVTARAMEKQESGEMEETGKGGMKVTSTIWLAKEVPGMAEMKAFQQRMAEELGFKPGESGLKQLLQNAIASHPQLGAALERVQEETAKLEGVALETYTVFETWGESAKKEEMEEEEVPKSVGGLLKGFGKKLRKKKKKDKKEASVLMEMQSRTLEMKVGDLSADLFAVPQGYKVVKRE